MQLQRKSAAAKGPRPRGSCGRVRYARIQRLPQFHFRPGHNWLARGGTRMGKTARRDRRCTKTATRDAEPLMEKPELVTGADWPRRAMQGLASYSGSSVNDTRMVSPRQAAQSTWSESQECRIEDRSEAVQKQGSNADCRLDTTSQSCGVMSECCDLNMSTVRTTTSFSDTQVQGVVLTGAAGAQLDSLTRFTLVQSQPSLYISRASCRYAFTWNDTRRWKQDTGYCPQTKEGPSHDLRI